MARLTDKQKLFVDAYLANGFNATQAAIEAGYSKASARSIGAENLTKPDIRAVIDARMKAATMRADEALFRLSAMARGSLGDFAGVKDISDLGRHPQAWLVKKLERRETSDGAVTLRMELHDPQAALVQIGRHYALFTDRQMHSWDEEAIADIRAGRIAFEPLAAALGDVSLAEELFRRAGVAISRAP